MANTTRALPYLRAWRQHKGMRIEDLAFKSGLSIATITKLETQPRAARTATVDKIVKALRVSRNALMNEAPVKEEVNA